MPNTRLVLAALATAMCFAGTASAADISSIQAQVSGKFSSTVLSPLAAITPAAAMAQSTLPTQLPFATVASAKDSAADDTAAMADDDDNAQFSDAKTSQGLRDMLIGLAMELRHVRYVRGGRDPSTGFDCSGFVRYVFERAIGLQLPSNSASQYLVGKIIHRDAMQPGDLVFFRTAGGRHGKGRISHVAIYIGEGRFIHSPRRGESVRVDNLSDSYWAKHFAGARRPEAMAQIDAGAHNG